MYITVLGPQGSGKSTQAKLLSEFLKVPYFSTGSRIREIASNPNNPLYAFVNETSSKGELVSNVVINKILNLAIEDSLKVTSNKGLVIDGTPRRLNQMEDIDEILKLHNQKLDLAIFVDVSIEECKKRIASRVEIEKRVDDAPEAVTKRLEIYFKETFPIIEEYKRRGILLKVDGERTIEEIAEDIKQQVSKKFGL